MNPTDINIAFATKKDIDLLVDVYSEWSQFKDVLPKELTEPETHESLTKYFNGSDETRKYLIATVANRIPVGACYMDISFLKLRNLRLGDMIVKNKYRKQGIGSQLVDAVVTFAQQNQSAKVWLWTQKELHDAIRLYEKKGFILEGTIQKQFCNKDALLYGLILD